MVKEREFPTYTHVEDPIPFDEELLIFGDSIETEYGTFRFYGYHEYLKRMEYLTMMSFSMLKFYYTFRSQMKEAKASREELITLKEIRYEELFDFIRGQREVLFSYLTVFGELIDHPTVDYGDPEIFMNLESDDFYRMRQLILRMHLLKEERLSPSIAVQDQLDKGKKFRSAGQESPNTDAIISSIVVATGMTYEQIRNMTAYQVLVTYSRIHSFKDNELTTLFATVSPDMEISRWDKNHEILKDDLGVMEGTQFNKQIGSIFE